MYAMLGSGTLSRSEIRDNTLSESHYVSDTLVCKHARFPSLTQHIRERRGKRVHMDVPVFRDVRTEVKTVELDCMCFGMGLCCLVRWHVLR